MKRTFKDLSKYITLTMLAAPVFGALPAAAQEAVVAPVLHQTAMAGLEGMEANIVRFDVEPGWATPRHTHPGHLFVYVVEGTLEIDVEGAAARTILAGEAVYELPEVPMVGANASSSEGAVFIVFQVGSEGEPLMVAHTD